MQVILFPMAKRVGRVRDVAAKLLAKPTERAVTFYQDQVNDALLKQMAKAGVPDEEQDEQIGAFWSAVNTELMRRTYSGRLDDGGAA